MGMVICAAVEEGLALGLHLAGVHDIFAMTSFTEKRELVEWYRKRTERDDIGVMILSSETARMLSAELFQRRVSGELLPVTVVIPGEGEDARAMELIRRAVGMGMNMDDNEQKRRND